jgi:hypothetical protein
LKALEEHLADFLMANPGQAFLPYRRRCMEFWRRHYGDAVASRVEALVKSRWKGGKGEQASVSH